MVFAVSLPLGYAASKSFTLVHESKTKVVQEYAQPLVYFKDGETIYCAPSGYYLEQDVSGNYICKREHRLRTR